MLNIIADIVARRIETPYKLLHFLLLLLGCEKHVQHSRINTFLQGLLKIYRLWFRLGSTSGSSIIASTTTDHVNTRVIVNIVIAAAAVDEIIAAAANDIHALSNVAVNNDVVVAFTTAHVQAGSLIGRVGLSLTIGTGNGYTAILTLGNIVSAAVIASFPNYRSIITLGYTIRIILS